MPCSSVLTTILSLTGLLLSLSSLYVTTKLKDESFVPPCDLSPTLNCSTFLSTPYSTGLGLVTSQLGEDHPANLPNSVFSIIIFSLILLTSFMSNMMVTTLMLIISTSMLITKASVVAISLPVMCPLSLASLGTALLLVFTMMWKRRSLVSEMTDMYGYSKPKSTNNNTEAFKKFI